MKEVNKVNEDTTQFKTLYSKKHHANSQPTQNSEKIYHVHKTGFIFILHKGKGLRPNGNVGDEYKDTINRI